MFEKIPNEVIIAAMTLIGGGAGWIGQRVWERVTKRLDEKRNPERKPKPLPHLIHHQIFAQLDEMEAWFRYRYTQPDLGRTILSAEMVVHKIRIWRPILLTIAKETDECITKCGGMSDTGCNKVMNRFLKVFVDGMTQYVNWHKEPVVYSIDGTKVYNETDKATMDLYVRKFQEWHEAREELVSTMTKEIGEAGFYETCAKRAWDILSIYQTAFIAMKIDAEKTLKSLNGELTKHVILGVTIGDQH